MDATGRRQYGQNRKGAERFFEKGSWIKKSVLLGKIAINGDEFDAKKTGKISNNLHLENNGGLSPKLWVELVKLRGKKGSAL